MYLISSHLISSHLAGRYLGTIEENDKLTLLHSKDAKLSKTLFRFRQSLVSLECSLNTLIEQSRDNTKLMYSYSGTIVLFSHLYSVYKHPWVVIVDGKLHYAL